jgi:hypothetical protein
MARNAQDVRMASPKTIIVAIKVVRDITMSPG